jgi:hypothetical protein
MNKTFGSTGFVRNIGVSDSVPGAASLVIDPNNIAVPKQLAVASLRDFEVFVILSLA